MTDSSQQPTLTTDSNDDDPSNYCPGCEKRKCICTDEPPEPDGECYRGGEYAAYVAHEMAEARKLK